jgi:hypothetical protein
MPDESVSARPWLLIEEWLPIAEIGEESVRERRSMTALPPTRIARSSFTCWGFTVIRWRAGVGSTRRNEAARGSRAKHTVTKEHLHVPRRRKHPVRGVSAWFGSWTRCTKEQIKLALKNKTIRLLICNDAAGEGLNLQYTGVLVNYDLPWNPMKVEQRIGRIDRIGQQHPIIRVINLAYKDAVEADVYFALGQRINLFQGIVGKVRTTPQAEVFDDHCDSHLFLIGADWHSLAVLVAP